MTRTDQHTDFTTRLMPGLNRIARKRFRRRRDRDDWAADFMGRGWEAYVRSARNGRLPSLRAVLAGMNGRRPRSNDLLDRRDRLLSLSVPEVRRAVEAVPA